MDNSWVKLYRKIADNDVFFDDKALRVFIWLLTIVDKKTGIAKIGRFWASDCVRLNPNTFKDVLKRLEQKYQIVTTKSTNKYTEVSLMNWAKYQAVSKMTPQSDTNKTPTKHQQNTTIQDIRIENREDIENTNTNVLVTDKPSEITLTKRQMTILKQKFPYQDVDSAFQKFRAWQHAEGKEFKNPLKRFEMWLIDDQRRNEKKANAIMEDPMFTRLLSVYGARIGAEWEMKSRLIDRLNDKYPAYKYPLEWDEAKKTLREYKPEGVRMLDTTALVKKMTML